MRSGPTSKIAIDRLDGIAFLPESQEAVVVGGSGLLYSHVYTSGADNLRHYLRYPAVMQAFGKPTFALGLGVQGQLQRRDLDPYVDILNAMNLRTVRDARSAQILSEAGVSAPIIEGADVSYLMTLPEIDHNKTYRKPVLGIAVSQPHKGVIHKEYEGLDGHVLVALANLDRDFEMHFYSFDCRIQGAIANDWTRPHSFSVYDPTLPNAVECFARAIGESDLFLTSHLHGMILSARMGIPFVSIGEPGEKIELEARALESPFYLPYSADSDDITEAVRNAWASCDETAKDLATGCCQAESPSAKDSGRSIRQHMSAKHSY